MLIGISGSKISFIASRISSLVATAPIDAGAETGVVAAGGAVGAGVVEGVSLILLLQVILRVLRGKKTYVAQLSSILLSPRPALYSRMPFFRVVQASVAHFTRTENFRT